MNPQWNSFQPPVCNNTDSAILDYKANFPRSNNALNNPLGFLGAADQQQQRQTTLRTSSFSGHSNLLDSQQQQQQQRDALNQFMRSYPAFESLGGGTTATTPAAASNPSQRRYTTDSTNRYSSRGFGDVSSSRFNDSSNRFNDNSSNNRFSDTTANRYGSNNERHDIFSELVSSPTLQTGSSARQNYQSTDTSFPSDFGGTFNARAVTNSSMASISSTSNFSRQAFDSSNIFGKSGNERMSNDNENQDGIRETGIIEKLLHSYGFIQCCERQARLFFHFSQFDGNIEHLKIGDPVEFEMTYDKRTGKPIASVVSKISSEILTQQVLSEERVMGTVATEIKTNGRSESGPGRISYENRGECFFLPYTQSDIEGHVSLRSGDKVSFQICNNARTGNLAAVHVRLEDPARTIRYRGIVHDLKDSYGHIERGDVVREIFFNFSESKAGELCVGDHVEFTIQTRQGKEIATAITKLPSGTVVLEEVATEIVRGQVLKTLERTPKVEKASNLSGRIRFRGPDRSEVEIPYGEKDQKRAFTLRHGDWVQFNIAMDRRDKQKRATNLRLLEESFKVSGEKREQGIIEGLLEQGYGGFIRSTEREKIRLLYETSEVIDVDRNPAVGDEVEFTVCSDPVMPSRIKAIRIKIQPANTVKFEQIVQSGVIGEVICDQSSWAMRQNKQGNGECKDTSCGIITYHIGGMTDTIQYNLNDCDMKNVPKVGDKVQFSIQQIKATKETRAVDVMVMTRAPVVQQDIEQPPPSVPVQPQTTSQQQVPPFSPHVQQLSQQQVQQLSPLQIQQLSPQQLQHLSPQQLQHLGSQHLSSHQIQMNPPMTQQVGQQPSPQTLGNLPSQSVQQGNQVQQMTTSVTQQFSSVTQQSMAQQVTTSMAQQVQQMPTSVAQQLPDTAVQQMSATVMPQISSSVAQQIQNSVTQQLSSSAAQQMPPVSQQQPSPLPVQPSSQVLPSSTLDADQVQKVIPPKTNPEVQPAKSHPEQKQLISSHQQPLRNGQIKRSVARGFIAALKDGFGFIETEAHDREVFFHFSNLEGEVSNLELGCEVEYTLNNKAGGKQSAECVKALPKGSIPMPNTMLEVLEGTVLRPLRAMNPDQQHYAGLIVQGRTEITGVETPPGKQYEFGITSLVNKREILQPGDLVQFQAEYGTNRSRNIQAIRTKFIATVESIKGGYGFLSHEIEGGKKLFFHMSEVKDNVSLNQGDQVEFVVLNNPRTGKSSACNVLKISEAAPIGARPERLVNRLRAVSIEDSGPRQVVVRQPKGPDGTRGFPRAKLQTA